MARLIAFNAIFFLLPFFGYAAWLFATRGSIRNAGDWPVKTIAWLATGGAILMFAALLVFIQFTGSSPGSHYVPAKVIDGVLVPGHFE